MNTIFNDNTYFEYYQKFNSMLKQIAEAEAVIKHLAFRGVPEGSIVFSSPKKSYTTVNGEKREYEYTNAYLYINKEKYYISKKFEYVDNSDGRDLNDFTNPANYLFLMVRFRMRAMAVEIKKFCTNCAKSLAKLLNAIKAKELPRIKFEKAKEEACQNFFHSEENYQLENKIDDFLDLPVRKQLSSLDLRPTVFCEESKCETKKARKKWFKLRKCSIFEDIEKNATYYDFDDAIDMKNLFSNSIINECGEQVRSKNEIIAMRCARDCGLSYELEPYYPGTNFRADMLIRSNGRDYYIEIAGWRDKDDYEERLKEKLAYAQEHCLPVIVIDMTAYSDKFGKSYMRMNYSTICRIFMYIQTGMLKEGIVFPY